MYISMYIYDLGKKRNYLSYQKCQQIKFTFLKIILRSHRSDLAFKFRIN
jgi:hypothetical protein